VRSARSRLTLHSDSNHSARVLTSSWRSFPSLESVILLKDLPWVRRRPSHTDNTSCVQGVEVVDASTQTDPPPAKNPPRPPGWQKRLAETPRSVDLKHGVAMPARNIVRTAVIDLDTEVVAGNCAHSSSSDSRKGGTDDDAASLVNNTSMQSCVSISVQSCVSDESCGPRATAYLAALQGIDSFPGSVVEGNGRSESRASSRSRLPVNLAKQGLRQARDRELFSM